MGRIEPAERLRVDNGAGWSLELRVYRDVPDPGRPPLVFVPGYAMNAHILGYHPSGPSIVEHLVRAGFEVWTANLRGQGGSARTGATRPYGLGELALDDLPVVFDEVLRRTETGADRFVPIGCSLGASLVYAWLAHTDAPQRVAAVVGLGGPLRWEAVHPLMRVAFASGRVAGALPFRGTRTLATLALPALRRMPGLLSIYMNADGIDLERVEELVPTIDDPVPAINRQLARWLRDRDLVVRGRNVTEALAGVNVPVLAVIANRDGIVPPSTARSVEAAMPGRVSVLEVGTPERWYAHADLFIGRRAEAEVFAPLSTWLRARTEQVDPKASGR